MPRSGRPAGRRPPRLIENDHLARRGDLLDRPHERQPVQIVKALDIDGDAVNTLTVSDRA